jgi:hypothetical protein
MIGALYAVEAQIRQRPNSRARHAKREYRLDQAGRSSTAFFDWVDAQFESGAVAEQPADHCAGLRA